MQNYVSKNKIVVVDITADWCLTCKLNKIRVLNDEEIMAILNSADIVAMRADITRPDMKVMNFMKKYNRYGIPFNAVFSASTKTGLLTSELLTKKELINLIEKARNEGKF
jgi:suppressor for copper-sensitivity B